MADLLESPHCATLSFVVFLNNVPPLFSRDYYGPTTIISRDAIPNSKSIRLLELVPFVAAPRFKSL